LSPANTPKRGRRTIDLDGNTMGLLVGERHKHQRIAGSIPDEADVDLSLVACLPAR